MVKKRGFRFMLITVAIALIAAVATNVAFAGTTWFNVTVPKFGRCTNTNLTLKNTWTNKWEVYNLQTGGNKTLLFRPRRRDGKVVGHFYKGKTGSHVWGPYYSNTVRPGDWIYGQICTRWYEPVNVQAWGTFNSH